METGLKKILLVDDSNFSRNLLKRSLGNQYQILEAGSGLTGIEIFVNERPDLVILDITMPDMNGVEVLEKMRQIDQNARILIGSADVQSFTQNQVMAMGASGYLPKPFSGELIRSVVQALLQDAHEALH